ncbi:hypothetical protein [Leptolyngbya sp. FACHB-16]|uniref:hypothetical protein n=1 Tax=unclassified Leptolyngbya TaxID=2650499 RepID=UPI001683841B|nr:hypothetical protein [Leptolyngbya sp. FACHB-16]MBD2154612.1 hypothetical protein [Leptolyngbya sp. FACHB-16]
MKLPPECWCFARFAGKAPTFWVNSYAETSLVITTYSISIRINPIVWFGVRFARPSKELLSRAQVIELLIELGIKHLVVF